MKKEGGGLQASLLLNPAKHSTSFTPLFNLRRRQAHMFCSVSCCAGLCARALGTCLCFGLLNLLRSPPHPSLSTSSPPPPFVPPCLFPQLPGNAFATESPYGVCSVLCPSNLCPPWTQPRLFWKHHIGCKPHRAPPPQHCLSPRPPPPSLPALPTPTHSQNPSTQTTPTTTTMPFIDTLRAAIEKLRAMAKASIPSHKVGEEETTVDPALKGVENEVRGVGKGNVWGEGCVRLCVRAGRWPCGGARQSNAYTLPSLTSSFSAIPYLPQ